MIEQLSLFISSSQVLLTDLYRNILERRETLLGAASDSIHQATTGSLSSIAKNHRAHAKPNHNTTDEVITLDTRIASTAGNYD